ALPAPAGPDGPLLPVFPDRRGQQLQDSLPAHRAPALRGAHGGSGPVPAQRREPGSLLRGTRPHGLGGEDVRPGFRRVPEEELRADGHPVPAGRTFRGRAAARRRLRRAELVGSDLAGESSRGHVPEDRPVPPGGRGRVCEGVEVRAVLQVSGEIVMKSITTALAPRILAFLAIAASVAPATTSKPRIMILA